MSEVNRLHTEVERFRTLLEAAEHDAGADPDFAASLQMSSLRAKVHDLQRQLQHAKEKRDREVVELRLDRGDLGTGSLPLLVMGTITSNLAKAWHAASYHMQTGRGRRGKIPAPIVGAMDLRFAGLQPGSSRLLVSGALSPNLHGESLLEKSLVTTFDLLHADDDDALTEAISTLGIRSMRRLRDVLDAVHDGGFALAVRWNTPYDEERTWTGDRERLRRLTTQLNEITTAEVDEFVATGILIGANLRGRFELRSDEQTYRGTFPEEIIPSVQRVQLGDDVKAHIEAVTYVNEAAGTEKTQYQLLGIERADPIDDDPS